MTLHCTLGAADWWMDCSTAFNITNEGGNQDCHTNYLEHAFWGFNQKVLCKIRCFLYFNTSENTQECLGPQINKMSICISDSTC